MLKTSEQRFIVKSLGTYATVVLVIKYHEIHKRYRSQVLHSYNIIFQLILLSLNEFNYSFSDYNIKWK